MAGEALLTVVAWPGAGPDEAIALLAGAEVMDAATARMRARQPTPLILLVTDGEGAAHGAGVIGALGGDAFATPVEELARFGASLKIKDMRIEGGAIAIDLWQGLSTTLRREQIEILVRGEITRRVREGGLPDQVRVGTPHPYHLRRRAQAAAERAASKHRTSTSHVLDIHTRDGSVYQIDGDRFGFGVLGAMKGHADRVNVDRVCELLEHVVEGETVDRGFGAWKAPPGLGRSRAARSLGGDGDPAFAFYSRWAAVTHRHIAGRA